MSLANWVIKLIEAGLEGYQPDMSRAINQLPGDMVAPPSGGSRGTVALSDDDPEPVGAVAGPGTSGEASRADHIHDGAGTVTSVALTMPSAIFDVAGSPITSSGTLAVTLDNQSANRVLAGPISGGAATPAFREIDQLDIPLNANEVAWGAAATDTLTSNSGLTYSGGSAILSIGEGLNIGTSAPVVSSASRRYMAMRGVSDAAVWEGSTGAADSDGAQVAQFIAADRHSGAADKRLGGMTIATQGTTAGNRGGFLGFYTKADNASGMLFRAGIDRLGRMGIGTSAPTRTLSIDTGTLAYLSFNVSGVEKWVIGVEPTVSDRLIIYNATLTSYSMTITPATDRVAFNGVVASGSYFHIGTTPVLGARITGWGAATNTTSRATFDTTTVTLPQLASRVGALINDLRTHGMIGA